MDWERSMRGARYHEAGHAVAAYRSGWEVTGITTTDDEWGLNFRRPAFGGPSLAWMLARLTLAGQLADQRASWGEMRPEPWAEFLDSAEFVRDEVDSGDEAARDDHLDLLEELEQITADPYERRGLEACYLAAVEEAAGFVSEHWAEIEAVALALEQTGTLDGPTVVRAIEGAA